MVENQHKLITGYRELTNEEITLMNEGKALAVSMDEYIQRVAATTDIDLRWLAIGKTDLQRGMMAVIRSIARPTTF